MTAKGGDWWDDEYQEELEKLTPTRRREFRLLNGTEQQILWAKTQGVDDETASLMAGLSSPETVTRYMQRQIPASLWGLYKGYPELSQKPSVVPLQVAEEYFRYSRDVLNLLRQGKQRKPLISEPFRTRDMARAFGLLVAGRVQITNNGSYPDASRKYEKAWELLEPSYTARDRADRTVLHVTGLVTHELANALAMFGNDGEARGYANKSFECYQAVGKSWRLSSQPLSVGIGKVRARVVRQQANAYVGFPKEVQGDFQQIEPAALIGTVTDHYGLAKSYHFIAHCAWFDGDYEAATRHARSSYEHAKQVKSAPWIEHEQRVSPLLPMLPNIDWWWLFRDFGPYARAWWQAIASAQLADILACRGWLGDSSALAEARDVYAENEVIRGIHENEPKRSALRAISLMPTAVGMYKWIIYSGNRLQTSQYLHECQRLSDHVGMKYCQVLARLSAYFYFRQSNPGSEIVNKFYQSAEELAKDSHNEALIALVKSGCPVPDEVMPVRRKVA